MEQVNSLKDCITVFDVISRIADALVGLTITTDKITFTFPVTDVADNVKTFTQLAAQMNKSAKAQKRVMAKLTDVSNEKYIFRIWLLALGMGGGWRIIRKNMSDSSCTGKNKDYSTKGACAALLVVEATSAGRYFFAL